MPASGWLSSSFAGFGRPNASQPSVNIHENRNENNESQENSVNSFSSIQLSSNNSSNSPKTPRSAAENSAVLSQILELHPSFSVFKKAAASDVHQPSPLSRHNLTRSTSSNEEQEVLNSPSVRGPFKANDLGVTDVEDEHGSIEGASVELIEGHEDENSGEWHLSEVEMSLNFGSPNASTADNRPTPLTKSKRSVPKLISPDQADISRTESSASFSPSVMNREMNSTSPFDPESPGCEAVQEGMSSINTTRTSQQHFSSPTGEIYHVTMPTPKSVRSTRSRLSFSPISFAPSPLLNNPMPDAVPPPPDFDSPAASLESFLKSSNSQIYEYDSDSPTTQKYEREFSYGMSGILKKPKTPGTGRSVRFSNSTIRNDLNLSVSQNLVDISGKTLLQRMQAIIPSPESSIEYPMSADLLQSQTSLLLSQEQEGNVENRFEELPDGLEPPQAANVTSSFTDMCMGTQQHGNSVSNLFDVSAPNITEDWTLQDARVPSVPVRTLPRQPSIESDHEKLTDSRTPRGRQGSIIKNAFNALVNRSVSPVPQESTDIANDTDLLVDTPLHVKTLEANSIPSPLSTPSRSLKRSGSTSAFYRMFMKSRAAESSIAAEEVGRLEMVDAQIDRSFNVQPTIDRSQADDSVSKWREETSQANEDSESPLKPCVSRIPRLSKRTSQESINTQEESVNVPPQTPVSFGSLHERILNAKTNRQDARTNEDGSAQNLWEDQRSAVDMFESEFEDTGSIVDHAELPKYMLSPIQEVSEPATSVYSPVSIKSPETMGSASTRRMLFYSPATHFSPEVDRVDSVSRTRGSRIPTPITPIKQIQKLVPASPNPFILQGAQYPEFEMIQSLVATQGDLMANSSSLKFLLSSLISNCRIEIERKDSMIENLKEQLDETEESWQTAIEEARVWESAAREQYQNSARESSSLLEDMVNRLTSELDRRIEDEKRDGLRRDLEEDKLRDALAQARNEISDNEVHLRHARSEIEEGNASRNRLELEVNELRDQYEEVARELETLREERDDYKQRVLLDLEERETSLMEREADNASFSSSHEVERLRMSAARNQALLKDELESKSKTVEQQGKQISDQKLTIQSLREQLATAAQKERVGNSDANLASMKANNEIARMREIINDLAAENDVLKEELADIESRIEAVQVERDVAINDLDARRQDWDGQIRSQQKVIDSVTQVETEILEKSERIAYLEKEYEDMQTLMQGLLDDRDRKLANAETELSIKKSKCDMLQNECQRLKQVGERLRKESADKEVKITKQRALILALKDDAMGLNMALEAKQQELSLLKREKARLSGGSTTGRRTSKSSGRSILNNTTLGFPQTPSPFSQEGDITVQPRASYKNANEFLSGLGSSTSTLVSGKENNSPRRVKNSNSKRRDGQRQQIRSPEKRARAPGTPGKRRSLELSTRRLAMKELDQ